MPKITYIIPIWANTTKKELDLSLTSLIKELEYISQIIIVHDGKDSFLIKPNSSLEILDKKILHLYLYFNKGPGIARNYGCIFSKSNYIFFLDAGDESLPKEFKTNYL